MEAFVQNLFPLSMILGGVGAFLMAYVGLSLHFEAQEARKAAAEDSSKPEPSVMRIVTPEQLFFLTTVSGFIGGALLYTLFGDALLGGIGAIVGLILPQVGVYMAQAQELKKFDLQLVDALTTMSNSMKAGNSLIQAIEMVAKEMSPPISTEFSILIKENRLGVQLDKALMNLTRRVASPNLELVVSSITVVRQAGGDLPKVFDTIAETIRERIRMEGRINALTAQGKLQGLVLALVPVGLVLVFNSIDPTLMAVLVEDPLGNGIIVMVGIFYLIAGYMTYKIVNIDV